MLGTNPYSLPARLGSFQELSQLLLEDLQALGARCIGHTKQWTPQVERIGDVGTDAQQNKKDEVDWISEDCFTRVSNDVSRQRSEINSPATISFQPSARSKP